MAKQTDVLITDLNQYEFLQAIRLQMFQHSHQRQIGMERQKGAKVLNQFTEDLIDGPFSSRVCDWSEIFREANELSVQHTREHGYRSFDLLHVAVALHLQADEFLTFDKKQQALAKSVGLDIAL